MATKPSRLVLEHLQASEARLKKNISVAEVVASGINSEFWATLRGLLKDRLASVENGLDAFAELTGDQRVLLLAERAVIRQLLGIEHHGLDKLRESLANVKKNVSDYAEKLKEYEQGAPS